MSRPGSTLIQPEQEQLYVPCGPPASHYKAPVQQTYPPYNPPPQGTPSPYPPSRSSPVRKYTPPKSKEYSPQYQSHYLSPSSQHIPVTVKSSPVCQADVSHEILRPTPRRPPSSVSPPRAPPAHPQQSPLQPAYPRDSPQLVTIPVSAAPKAGSPPSRGTPVSRHSVSSPGPNTGPSSLSHLTPVATPKPGSVHSNQSSLSSGSGRGVTPTGEQGSNRLSAASPAKSEHSRFSPVGSSPRAPAPPHLPSPNSLSSSQVKLGSPFWCGVGSRDPLSRQFEYPERDVPPTTTAAPSNISQAFSGKDTTVSSPDTLTQAGKSMHVTNLLIDRGPSRSYSNIHNLNLPVPAYEEVGFTQGSAGDEEEESGGEEEHPAVRGGRSSLIKYKAASSKSKPKRKFVAHTQHPGSREKLKRHEHVKHGAGGGEDRPARGRSRGLAQGKQYGGELSKANQLLEVKAALEQLSIGNSLSLHSSTSYSSMSECEEEEEDEDEGRGRRRRVESSQETLSTTVTSADEFVWIDSHNRLVEVQQLPWTSEDLVKVVQQGTVRESASKVSMEVIPRLSYYMQRVLVRLAREAQRLAQKVHKCSKYEVMSALRLVLCPTLASSSIKACLRAGAMYNISSDQSRQTKSSRAGVFLDIGKVHQWMCTVRIGKFIQEYAAVYLTAGLENILEEVLALCLDSGTEVNTAVLETVVAASPELWGIFQPYAHLSSCRTSKGNLTVPKCLNMGASDTVRLTAQVKSLEKSLTQVLLTTCVGSKEELEALLLAAGQFYNKYYQPTGSSGAIVKVSPWSRDTLHVLYHFMRCSQLENQGVQGESGSPIQELVYERPYMVLPPLVEWLRVSTVFAESRFSTSVEKDDVFQAARILLPGADFPPRGQAFNSQYSSVPTPGLDELEYVATVKRNTAFQMLLSGRKDVVPHALQLLPSTKVNTSNQAGLTPLMLACVREDVGVVRMLLETGASIDWRNPGPERSGCIEASPEQQHWAALHYATMTGNYDVVRLLLEKGASVEGNIDLELDILTETPLQLAAASGRVEIVELLLSFGSSPFLSTLKVDTMSFGSSAQKGCYCALSTAASHGQRKALHKLVTHPTTLTSQNSGREVLSLEEILAEGVPGQEKKEGRHTAPNKGNLYSRFTKSNVKKLQEAMYHSTENGNIEITLDLRNFGVPWTLHSWIRTLLTAQQGGLSNILDELLQDFSKEWTEDNSTYFTDECLPVLFSIFRTNKSEGTTLFLADVLSACYGKDHIDKIVFTEQTPDLKGGPRIDPKFVNNPELSDIQFRVEGRLFYAHKLVLITSSFKFRSMLNSKFCEGSPPVLQINDIRYEIFEMVMQYLYNGSAEELPVQARDILELMAAANFFQLDGLLHFCEVRCASLIDLDTIVSYYIHAKVYSAKHLLAYCEGFLLQNMVALLTYDDSVKRLIFGKKLQNHDVITGLLRTLQERVKRKGPSKSKKHSL